MVNCNPETVSTDYDTSDRLYFEPLTVEDVLAVVEAEQPVAVIVQLGGQTPLSLAPALEAAGVPIAGTISGCHRCGRRSGALRRAVCRRTASRNRPTAPPPRCAEAEEVVDDIGLPGLVRPSYVLGGRAMRIIYYGR